MKANINDYKKDILSMVDQIDDLDCIIRLWAYVKMVFKIQMERKEKQV